jgi:hypothetical protein
MHTDTGIRSSVGSLATNIQAGISAWATKMQRWITSLGKTAKKGVVARLSAHGMHNIIPPVAVLAGAAAFGFWWERISAGLFAGLALVLLAGIYKALRQIVAALRWEHDRVTAADWNRQTSRIAERSDRNFEIGASAVEHLRPWVKDETSLTEESAKAYCSVLLETLAVLHPKFAE